ncbi:Reverse transcriptase [Theobroma cacao]|nr:Reverse transcriptase [Theobroma cacao]
MEPGKNITSMFDRFTNITNKSSQLGKPIPEHELVKRLLRSLPKSWKPKVTAIRVAKDLNIITLDEICGSLLTHELELKEEEEEDRREVKEKKKSIALKVNILEKKLKELSCDDDEELALVARKFRKLMSRRNRRLTRRDETPKKNKKSKKAMVVATWSDSDTSSFETDDEKSEERANIYLMAQEDEIEVELQLKETCSRAQLKKKQPWYLDSGCSRHMTGHEMLFAQLDKRKGGIVSFGDDSKGRIHGIEAEKEESWIMAMKEELDQFHKESYEQANVVRNKARLVVKGYNQEEGIDYDETFALVARIEAIRLLLAFTCSMNFKLFQMDVKSAFLNGLIQEEVYVEQLLGFEDFEKSDHVFKLHKALYGLKQTPRAWYERLSKFLVEKGYDRGNIDTTLFIKRYLNDLIIVQIYVDDIVFGATNEALCKNFAKEMQGEFEMSMMGELKYFLGLQIKQSEEEIFINQERYTHDMLKKFDMLKLKSTSTPMSPSTKLGLDEKGKDVDQKLYAGIWYSRNSTLSLVEYSYADFASSRIDKKSTSGTCQFLGRKLVSWSTKKQNSVALSTAKAEYVSLGSCCAQIL